MSATDATATPPPRAPLFRAEALAHVGTRAHGVVLLARPLSYTVLTALFVVVAATLIGFLVFGSYTRRVDVQGILTSANGEIRITGPQAGVVTESRVKEGQAVQAGDVLFVLSSERANALQGNAEQAISTLLEARRDSLRNEQAQLRQQAAQRTAAARRRIDDLNADLRRIDEQIRLQQRRVVMAQTTLQRYSDLGASNFVSPVQVQDKQAELLDQEQRLADLQRTSGASNRDLSTAQAELSDLQVQGARDVQSGERSVSLTEQDLTENEARRQVFVRAAEAGTVTAITAQLGQAVLPSQVLATLLPRGSELQAELYAPSRAVGFLKPGMAVKLRYQAYSFQKFGQATGHVREISRTAMRPDELTQPGVVASNEPVYRVRVALDRQSVVAYGAEQALRSGAQLDGSVELDTRHLYEWVLEPLLTVTGHL